MLGIISSSVGMAGSPPRLSIRPGGGSVTYDTVLIQYWLRGYAINITRGKGMDESNVCPAGDGLYPNHAFDAITDQPDGAEWVCAACGMRAEDTDEGRVQLLKSGYCEADQK